MRIENATVIPGDAVKELAEAVERFGHSVEKLAFSSYMTAGAIRRMKRQWVWMQEKQAAIREQRLHEAEVWCLAGLLIMLGIAAWAMIQGP